MLIKEADDKTHDLATLKSLLNHPTANAETKKRIEQEIRNISSGAKGEADAAYEIDFHYGPSKNWAVIHDLRMEHKGRVAQIDHLLVNRFLDIWVFESKRFAEGISINEQGECAMFWNGKPAGIASPHEQNTKHIAVIKAVCDDGAAELPKRLGFNIKPAFNGLVLVSKNARVSRPKSKGWWTDGIVKADQVKAKIDKAFDSDNNIFAAAKIVGSDTLESFARSLASLHVPASFDWHAKFGLSREAAPTKATSAQAESKVVASPAKPQIKKAEPVCYSCGAAVEEKVVTFCIRFNKARFGGKVYCQACQKAIPKPA
ncbi:nuclease-related domain-containing protein [Dechloromonas agitata]|uniref:nuclease-related domain-containing protein n=1 Tax=Dechloromonas agitata TaxID=73030 RepID=UPI00237ED5BB|nr:nuclease-related domain-containing protein [Dechloromonas agitata]MDE1547131.1 nuclease-related domain-containing protein [Dechloromonas agitata]